MKPFYVILNRISVKISFLLLIVSIILISISNSSCTRERSIYEDPDRKIAELIFEKKIVMLADMGHHTMRSYSILLNVLFQWREAAKLIGDNKSILLVMEKDSNDAKVINDFIANPNTDSLFYNFYDSWNLDDIEFLITLREFKLSLDSIKEPLLKIDLRGFEQVLDGDFYKLPEREGDLWFINSRDSITAMNLTNYITNNPEQNILIFYGGAHLQKGFVEKPSKVLTVQEKMGYYLANYLKKEYGDENVLTISQMMKDSNSLKFTPLEKYLGKEILAGKDSIPVSWDDANSDRYDMIAIRNLMPYPPHYRFNVLFSRKNIENATKRLEENEKLLPGFNAKFEYESILDILFLVTGIKFQNSTEAIMWYSQNSYDGIDRLKSDKFKEDLFNYYYEDPNNYIRKRRLNDLGFGPGVYGKMIPKEEWRKFETELMNSIRFHNSVSIYLLGYPYEQIKAKEILVEFSGNDFPDAFQYLEWYRKEQYNLPY